MTPPVANRPPEATHDAPRHPGADHHNAVLDAARARVDELEPKLAAVLEPILRRAGDEAARRFKQYATNHLTAAGPLTGVQPTSTMICVRPRPTEAAAIADPDGAPASDLHCTLAFLGEIEGPLDKIREALAPVAGQHGPLAGVVAGYGEFRPPDCGILLPDVPGLVELRCAVTEALVQAGIGYGRDHGFQPHITVDGDPEEGEIDEMLDRASGQPLHFDALLIVRGDAETFELPLVGPRPLTADAGLPRARLKEDTVFYHVTLTDNEEKILREGLLPQSKVGGPLLESGQLLSASDDGTFLATAEQAQVLADQIEELTGDEPVVFEVTLPAGTEVVQDAMMPESSIIKPGGVAADQLTKIELKTLAARAEAEAKDSRAAPDVEGLFKGVADRLAAEADWTAPAADELVDTDALAAQLRGKTDPIRLALIEDVLSPSVAAAGLVLNFDVANPLIDGLIAKTGQHIQGIADTTQANVMRAIGSSYQQGLSIPDTAKVITQVMHEAAGPRAIMIARTEMTSAVNGASLAAANVIGQATGKTMTKTWLTAPGALYPRHEEYDDLDGQTVKQDETFTVGEDELQYPGDPDGSPEEVINCFPGSTLVVASEASMGFRRRYVGSLVRVETGGGHMLSGTPNHPVLTSSGWKPLHLLQEGDYLVCGCRSERAAAAAPDVDDAPTPIQQVVGALARRSVTRRVRGGAMQFHGDGLHDGEVEVVASHRTLRISEDAAPLQPERELLLVGAHEVGGPLATSRSPREVGLAAGHASDGVVGSAGESGSLLRGRLAHPLAHGSGTAARVDAEFEKMTPDDSAVDAVALGQRLLGGAFEVSLAKVVTVKVDAFHGEVFNLQTRSGAYLAGGIIAHNCRCAMTYSDGSEVDAE